MPLRAADALDGLAAIARRARARRARVARRRPPQRCARSRRAVGRGRRRRPYAAGRPAGPLVRPGGSRTTSFTAAGVEAVVGRCSAGATGQDDRARVLDR